MGFAAPCAVSAPLAGLKGLELALLAAAGLPTGWCTGRPGAALGLVRKHCLHKLGHWEAWGRLGPGQGLAASCQRSPGLILGRAAA
eukprot:4234872-Lingulodinium_polyedra.AAC.1